MATYVTGPNDAQIRQRTRASISLPGFSAILGLASLSPSFDRMQMRREYLLSGLSNIAFEYPGELATGIRRERMRPTGLGAPLPDYLSFTNGNDRFNGTISFGVGTEAAGRKWLIGLELKFSRVSAARVGHVDSDALNAGRVRVSVNLQLNPTRIIAHAAQRRIDVSAGNWRDLLTSDRTTYEALCSMSVDRRDNVIPARTVVGANGTRHWVADTVKALEAVDEFLRYLLVSDDLSDRQVLGVTLVSPQEWQIKTAEVYQEFGRIDAPDFARRLYPAMRQIASHMRARYWESNEATPPVSYTMRLTEMNELSLYAKTQDRIRIEVKYNKRVPSLGGAGVAERFASLLADAAERINGARQAMLIRLAQVETKLDPAALVGRLCELSSRIAQYFSAAPGRHQPILEVLLIAGAVESGESGLITSEEARELVSLRILDNRRIARASRRGNRYPLSEHYAPLVMLFHGT